MATEVTQELSTRISFSLLCIPFNILRRLATHVDPIISPLLSMDQAGFPQWRSTVDQVTLLKQGIENIFAAKGMLKIFFLISPGSPTIWHRGFTCKLLRLLSNRHKVHKFVELVNNYSYQLPVVTCRAGYCLLDIASHRISPGIPSFSICPGMSC